MKIAICEDNASEREALAAQLTTLAQRRRLDAEVLAYDSGESLLAAGKKHRFSIVFIDIYLPGMNGMEAALKLRKSGSRAALVFTTVTRDFLAQSYSVWAVHYLVKPLVENEIDEAFSRALTVAADEEKTLEITVAYHHEYIPYSHIRYIEAQGRQCRIHTGTGIHAPYTSITELMEQLVDERFVCCHRSYIVNLEHVIGMQKDKLAVRGDVLVPVRRGEAAAMRERFESYRFGKTSGRASYE